MSALVSSLYPWEIKQGWYWANAKDTRDPPVPISASPADHRLMRESGLLKRVRLGGVK